MKGSLTSKIDGLLNKVPQKFKNFFYSDIYPPICAAVFFISWVVAFYGGFPLIGVIFAVLTASVALVICDDVVPCIPLLFMVAFSIGDTSDLSIYIPYLTVLIPLFIAIPFHLAHYRPKKFSFGSLGVPQLIITIVLLLGGCTSITLSRYVGALTYSLLLGVGVFFIYFAFYNYINVKDRKVFHELFPKTFLWIGVLLSAEILVYYIRYRFGLPVSEWLAKNWIDLGWGIDNNVATILLITAPMTFYLALDRKTSPLYVLAGVLQYLTILLTFSRGGILFAAITAPVVFIITIIKSKRKTFTIATLAVLALSAIVLFIVKFGDIRTIFSNIFSDGLTSSSRMELYKESLRGFARHPVFGLGGGYDGTNYENHVEGVTFYWFHSTLFQVIGGYGLLGIFAFGFSYFRKAIILKEVKHDIFFLFILLSFVGFELYSMIDTGTFVPIPNMMIIMVTYAVLEHDKRLKIKLENTPIEPADE